MMIRQGQTVLVRAKVLTNEDEDGCFKADISGDTYTFHKSWVVDFDPRMFLPEDVVESVIGRKPDMSGVVIGSDGSQSWVRWDDGSRTIESYEHLRLLKPVSALFGRHAIT